VAPRATLAPWLSSWFTIARPAIESVLKAYTGWAVAGAVPCAGSPTSVIGVPAGGCWVRKPSPENPRSSEYDQVTSS
jgi:hypothetical protein